MREARAYVACESGASAAEYALMLVVLAGCTAVMVHSLGRHISGAVHRVAAALH